MVIPFQGLERGFLPQLHGGGFGLPAERNLPRGRGGLGRAKNDNSPLPLPSAGQPLRHHDHPARGLRQDQEVPKLAGFRGVESPLLLQGLINELAKGGAPLLARQFGHRAAGE